MLGEFSGDNGRSVTVPRPSETPPASRMDFLTSKGEPAKNGEKVATLAPMPELFDIFGDKPAEEAPPVEPPKEPAPEPAVEPDPAAEGEPDAETPNKKNFKQLRAANEALEREKKELADKTKALEEENEGYKTGRLLADVVKEKDQKIQDLSFYEKLHNLKGSAEWQEKVTKPATEKMQALEVYAEKYKVPVDEMNKAINTGDIRERNKILSNYFDDIGGLEVKGLIEGVRKVWNDAREFEKEPAKTLASMQAESQRLFEENKAQAKSRAEALARNAWNESRAQTIKDGKAVEFIPRENDSQWNNEMVAPLERNARENYDRYRNELFEHGLQTLPPHLATATATMIRKAAICTTALARADRAVAELAELQALVAKQKNYERPVLGAGGRGEAGSAPTGAVPRRTAQEASAALVSHVMK